MDTNKKWVFLFLAAALIVAVLSSLSSVQKKLAPYLDNNTSRSVLAKVSTFYGLDQFQILILKVKDSQGLQIEIYEIDSKSNSQVLKQKFDLFQDSDAYVTIDKNSTNLALSDVDKDGQLDILAPSVDRNGNLRLNTFRYNSEIKNFEPFYEPTKSF